MKIDTYPLLDKWVNSLEAKPAIGILLVLKILRDESNLYGEDVFITPIKAFEEANLDQITYEAILFNLHGLGVIYAVDTIAASSPNNLNAKSIATSSIADNIRLVEPLFTHVLNLLQIKTRDTSDKPKKPYYPLALVYSGNLLQIRGTMIKNTITLVNVQSTGIGLLLKPIFKFSKASPDSFRQLTKKGLSNPTALDHQEVNDQIEKTSHKPSNLGKYFTGVGLKKPIRNLFLRKASSDMKYQFRSVITNEVWQDFPPLMQEEIVKYLSNLALSKK